MKVKNIAFSGFAAMILAGVCGVASAATYNLASKDYVDTQLAGKASIEDFENLESTVGKKATQEALKEVADQVVLNTNDIAELKGKGYITDEDLTNLQTTLQAAIDDKQDAGDYAAASELETLKATVENLQGGTVDKATIESLQTSVNAIVADYAKKSELTQVEQDLRNAIAEIKIPSLDEYAKIAYVDEKLASKADATALNNLVTSQQLTDLRTALEAEIANRHAAGDYATAEALQTVSSELATLKNDVYTRAQVDAKIADAVAGGEINLDGYAEKSALDALTALVSGNTSKITALENAGYQTSDQVQGAITTAVADLATKAEVNAKQDKLTQGTNISIEGNVISATGLAKSSELTQLQETLQAAIDEKQAAGEYLVASDLTELNNAITALQSGKADASTVVTIQETISKLGDTYATKSALTSAEERLQAAVEAIEIPSLAEYAKTADVDAKLALKADASALNNLVTSQQLTDLRTALEVEIANRQEKGDYATAEALQTVSSELATLKNDVYTKAEVDQKIADAVSGGEIDLSGYATTSALDALAVLVSGNTSKITALENAGYQTSDQVQGAITTAVADLATKAEIPVVPTAVSAFTNDADYQTATNVADAIAAAVDGKQDKLTAGTNIEIADNVISATIDTSSLVSNPTLPTDDGDYMLMVESNGGTYKYTWTNIKDYHPDDDWNLWE